MSGIFRWDGSEVLDPLRFFSSGEVIEPFYNMKGTIIENPIAYAAKGLGISAHEFKDQAFAFKGKIKGAGKHPGKKGLGYKGKDPPHKGSWPAQASWSASDAWASAELDWRGASWSSPHSNQESAPHRTKSKIDPKSKGKGWVDPIGSKGSYGKGKGSTLPDSHPNRTGGGSRLSSSSSSNRAPAKRERTRTRGPVDLLDNDSPTLQDHHDQWTRIKAFTQAAASNWLLAAEERADSVGDAFPLKWALPTKPNTHGGPDIESWGHFEMAVTWETVADKIFWKAYPNSAYCPGCWRSISMTDIEDDPLQVEERVIQHIESLIWSEHQNRPPVPLHPSPATWCHLIADRTAGEGRSAVYVSTCPEEEEPQGGVWAGDPSFGFQE
jgi:hypothetical protein